MLTTLVRSRLTALVHSQLTALIRSQLTALVRSQPTTFRGGVEVEALKLCEKAMVTCFRVAAGGLAKFQFPLPAEFQFPLLTTKKLDHIQGNGYFRLHAFYWFDFMKWY